ncbi:indolepyruvate ferredoxin oxidoreductase [Tepidimonas ignava]|uniref:Indolepyruvate ferredoxin oxidoreductase n=2 Tax=Pseudomonadati TaxID=3379134 RepID=A0A4R3LK60_9BURK|nr:indolepyruvate ferredoxin oxidoreductase family protein [Tepidimonas ignava]TCS98086.1 indolepyruvate ferredoxin oxidoreductase [Tepidimonas ignava]TSE22593.1 indolepyruvate ferredoxin oxidoreductase, alpha subunit [Tepidimonas ignava]
MTAPLPEHVQRALASVTLDDKYTLERGHAFMSGIQALVRLPMLQRQRDALAGQNTAGFISGYRGSPLGGYDQALWKARKHLQAHHVVFQPGVNEELAATAVWGTQQLGFAPPGSAKYDGVFGLWYGKGPGVDRCSDVFKHANLAGTTPWGGVIAVAGDDHVAKSSTAAHQSDHIFKACGLPVFFPASVQEILDLGLHAWAMSRYAGVWTGMKTIQEIVESSATVEIDPERVRIALPQDFELPPGGVHIRWPDAPLEQEARLMDYKWYAALAYVRANRLNHNVIQGPHDRYGIIASGKAYNDLRQALHDLGLDDDTCRQLGIRVHKVAVVWPLEAQITREFALGLREILVVEEKRQVIEYQLKEELYNWRPDVRPDVLGKFDEIEGDHSGGEWSMPNPSANQLLRANADLTPAIIARAVAKRLQRRGLLPEGSDIARRVHERLALIDARERALHAIELTSGQAQRLPWFCSGCPHNTSTRVPEGSRAMAGIGCHYMAIWMDRNTVAFTQMGGEGVPWVGQQPFTSEPHIFANLGDGTYFHSGLLAIRQAIAAGVNITYKILYNDAVAMTGGQPVGERPEGHSVLQIVHSLRSEGVRKLYIVTDEPAKYAHAQHTTLGGVTLTLPADVPVLHRDELDRVQRECRVTPGVTAIIYDQTCATEKRRRRKRGLMADPDKRAMINERVCEGCGDCGVQSNCLSVEPLETEFGRKRTINQSTCNKDFSCTKGFCPSFVTVEGAKPRKPGRDAGAPDLKDLPPLPEPSLPELQPGGAAWGIVVAGVGGTGVITIGQLLGVAAHLEGKGIVTQDAAGLAQKGGATWSHVLIGARQDDILTTRVPTAAADLILACDPIVAASAETLARTLPGRTHVALNAQATPTAAFVHDRDWVNPSQRCVAAITEAVGADAVGAFDAEALALKLLGDTLYVNPMVLGYAWQKGWIPLRRETLQRAIELNGVAVKANLAAFEWGRRVAHDLAAVLRLVAPAQVVPLHRQPTLEQTVRAWVEHLTGYQNAAYAQRYEALVRRVQQAETALGLSGHALALAVAQQYGRLLAYKDEYEVARLYTDGAFEQRLREQFEGDVRLRLHLAPPLLARRNDRGELLKREYGPWVLMAMRVLARLKGLRGTWLDPFGYTEERRTERALIAEYEAAIADVLAGLTPERMPLALAIACWPAQVRGFGHVKARALQRARPQWEELRQRWRGGAATPVDGASAAARAA